MSNFNGLNGSWRLVSFEQVLHSGQESKPLGESPSGLLLYQADGQMSAQLSVTNPIRFANDDPELATADEAVTAWRTFFSYFGFFGVRLEEKIVVHHVEGCSFPNWIGTEQIRHFRFDGRARLILETPSSSGRLTAIWQRTACLQNISEARPTGR